MHGASKAGERFANQGPKYFRKNGWTRTRMRAHDEIEVVDVSSFFDTAPVGGPRDQPRYLNAAAKLETSLTPRTLLNALLAIETTLGRDRSSPERNQPRSVDLDLLLYDQEI